MTKREMEIILSNLKEYKPITLFWYIAGENAMWYSHYER